MNISSISNLSSQLSASARSAQSAQTNQPKPSQDQKALLQAAKVVNEAQMFGPENEITFKIDRATGTALVRIVDRKTGELVQQIPSEDVLKMAEESNEG